MASMDADIMELPVFWYEWVHGTSPLLRGRVGRQLIAEGTAGDNELARSLLLAATRASSNNLPVWVPLPLELNSSEPVAEHVAEFPVNLIVADRLAPTASEALTAVELAIEKTPAIQVQLTGATNVFQGIAAGAGLAPGDEVDRRAADALASVDALVQEHAGLELKEVQRRAQDVLMLACARFMDEAALKDKGIPLEVRERLNKACQKDVLIDHDLWSRLGNAKYHLFTPTVQWASPRNRANRRHRHRAVGAAEAPVAAGAGALEVEVDVGASDEDPAPEPEPAAKRAAEGGRAPTPVPSDSEPEHEALPQRQDDAEDADSSEHDVVKEIENEFDSLPIEVDDCFFKVTDRLLDRLPEIREQAVVRQWVELLRQKPGLIFSNECLFRDLFREVVSVVQFFKADENIVRHCCVALGGMAEAMPALADDVCVALVNIMEMLPGSLVVQDVCVTKLGRKVCWISEMVLGLDMSQERPGALKPESQSRMLAAVRLAVARFGPDVAGSSQDDFRPGEIQENAFRVYCRLCSLPEVLEACGRDTSLVEFVLLEVFTALDIFHGPLSWCWSDTDASGIDSCLKEHHRSVLLQLAKQLSDQQHGGMHKEGLRTVVAKWIGAPMDGRSSEKRHQLERRLVLAGLFFNSGDVVTSVLFKALDRGIESGAAFEEELITSALRALNELKCLEVLEADLVNKVLFKIRDDRFRPKMHYCHAAYVGTLGMLAASRAAVAAPPFDKLTYYVVHEVIEIAKYWFNMYATESIIFESLWALNKLLTAYICFEPGLAIECWELATKVRLDETFSSWDMDSQYHCLSEFCTTSDGANALREAEKLLTKLQGQQLPF